jgi:hypothetical protein
MGVATYTWQPVRYNAPPPLRAMPADPFRVDREDLQALRIFVRELFNTPRQTSGDAEMRRKLMAEFGEGRGAAVAMPNRRRTFQGYVEELAEAIEQWFEAGIDVPPVYAERVQLFLKRAGQTSWERAFLAVICYHFAACHAGGYAGLIGRATELGAYPVPRLATRSMPAHRAPAVRRLAARLGR